MVESRYHVELGRDLMRHLLRLTDWSVADLRSLFAVAGRYQSGDGERLEGAAVLFFPPSSLRTRVSFERGASLMGTQPITFPPETLSKDEDPVDVVGHLACRARLVVARYPDIAVLDRMASAGALPIINAMTDVNHPCEVLSDLYPLSQDTDPVHLRYVFVGADGNIGRAWREAAQAFGLDIVNSPSPGIAYSSL